jgi:hypothetical protein
MKTKIINSLKYIFFLGIGVFLVWWSLQQIPPDKWDEFKSSLRSAKFVLLIPVFLILSTSHILRSIRWKILMQPMGYKPSIVNVFFAVMIGYLANLAVPRLGEVIKCTLLTRYEKIPTEKLVGTIVVERAIDVICLIIFFFIAFATQYQVVGDYGKQILLELFANKKGSFSFTKIIIGIVILVAIIIALKIWFKKFSHLKIVIGFKKILSGVVEGLSSIKHLQQKGKFLWCTLGIWCLYVIGTWVGLQATQGTAHLGLTVAVSALAFASLGMIATPGGIGAYAFFLAKVLEKNGVPYTIGFANGTLQWFAQFLLVVIVGFICLGLLPWYNKTKPLTPEGGNFVAEEKN